MKYLLISIGDIHISKRDSIDSKKIEMLSSLILSKCSSIDFLIFLINGDIVDKGLDEQFSYAIDFFCFLQKAVLDTFNNIDVSFIFSPGNHDCIINSSGEPLDSNNLKDEIKKSDRIDELSRIEESINDQTNFYKFCELFKNPYIVHQEGNKKLFRIFEYNYDNGKLRFFSVNSSILFNKGTGQGDIYLDFDTFNMNILNDSSFNILISHYPVEWYDRSSLEKMNCFMDNFSIIIFGHEHFGKLTMISNLNRNQIEINNPVFDSSSQLINNGVTLITINSENLFVDSKIYTFDGNIFDIYKENELSFVFGESNYRNELSTLNNDFTSKLNRIDGILSTKLNTNIDSIFVDLPLKFAYTRDISTAKNRSEEEIFEYTFSNNLDLNAFKILGFYGSMESGKTTLLRHLYFTLFRLNYIPILLSGSDLNRRLTIDILNNMIYDRYKKQYDSSIETLYQNRNKLILIVDDFHEIQDYSIKQSLIDIILNLNLRFVFSSSLSFQSSDLNQLAIQFLFQYEILDLGQTEIYSLIENWMKLNGEFDKPNYHKKLVDIKNKINAISKNKYVPLTPFFILMILKAYEENFTTDLENSHKKVYYEYLISSLIIDISKVVTFSEDDLQVHFKEMAYFYYRNEKPDFNDFVNFMKEKYSFDEDYQFSMRDLKNQLISRKVMIFDKNVFNFQYQFMYYTFLAQYITENIEDNPVDFVFLFNNISYEKYANILLFVSQYFAKKSIINKVIEKANSLLSEFKEIKYDNKDLEIYNQYIAGVKDVEKYGSVQSNHKLMTKLIDNDNRRESSKQLSTDEVIKSLDEKQKQMIEAIKVFLIINELLYNRISSDLAKELLNCAIALSRRLQSFFTFSYILAMNESKREAELSQNQIDTDEELKFIKRMTYMFLNIIIFCSEHLGNIKNYPIINNQQVNDENYKNIQSFIFKLKNPNDENMFDINEIKSMLEKFDNDHNYLLKGLVFSIINYELNYVGLSPKLISDLSMIIKLPMKDYKQLLAKATYNK